MPVTFGFCDFLYDPNTSALIGHDWAVHVRSYGVQLVRATISTGLHGNMPTGLLCTGIEEYGGVGVEVLGEFSPAFLPTVAGADMHSNMPLNTTGDTFTSPWIDGVTLRGEGVARQAVKSGMKAAVFGNEPNEMALLAPGARVLPGPKGGALSPQVAAATYWQAASRLRSVGMQEVYCGALSVLPQTGLDAANPYYAAWLTAFYETCATHGKHAPFPWAGWAVNCEGLFTAIRLQSALKVLRGIMTKYGDTGKIRITEWGWAAGPNVDPTQVDQMVAAIGTTEATSACFFQGPGAVPYLGDPALYKGFGAYQWRQNGNTLIPLGDYAWGRLLRPVYAKTA